ncbi:TetR/AcrR family transcriptional regulator [Aestuariivirga sp. YIM B02566]|uniref:TetR family transcriptional regulator n=1 Tax=Taklimakanibacter albus TaxID=2800327 RepID=A0ACC5R926_9HYPH|nr:TetR/AcrR family transcriptional regulator [Aestuariivirga sp. YIM B02566]MBK1869164.1 TetR family transcriptional regulator [Aestuariivirga sp. YIM B02566]
MATQAARDTRAQLLDAAEAVVAEQGVRALTLDAVAARSGISKGGLLYHFRSKEDLAAAMIERSIAWFDQALVEAGTKESDAKGRFTRAYVKASLGMTPLTGAGFDNLCSAITTALLSFPERLGPVQDQGARTQADVERDGLDPVVATIIRLAVDGLWLSENFNLMRFDPDLKAKVAARLLEWTRNEPK